jgi:nicotinamide mononucleotide transporter
VDLPDLPDLPDRLALILEIVSVLFALAYLKLAIRESVWCWPAALAWVALGAVVYFDAKLYMESALQIFYLAMAIYGWALWRRGPNDEAGLRVHWWSAGTHVLVVAAVVIVSAGFGWLMSRTDAAFPYVDSFTTVAAIVTTFMVARKVIENWIYWLVIDSILVYVNLARELYWYAALYAYFLILVVLGFHVWRKSLEAEVADG